MTAKEDVIKAEIKHLKKKIKALEKARDRDEVDGIDALEDLSNWEGWLSALKWVNSGCKGNPHAGDGYE